MFLQFSEFLQNETLTLGRKLIVNSISFPSDPPPSKNDMHKTEKLSKGFEFDETWNMGQSMIRLAAELEWI